MERRLSELGYARRDVESLYEWLRRIALLPGAQALEQSELEVLVRLHYCYRFDPLGLPAVDRVRLREYAQDWLARHSVLSERKPGAD